MPGGAAALAGISVGDHLVSVNAIATPTIEEFKQALAVAEEVTPTARLSIEVRRSEVEPDAEKFGMYCESHQDSRYDTVFQSKHRHVGAWLVRGDQSLDESIMLCDGCPECLFGCTMAELTKEQASDPKVLRWAARPAWMRHQPFQPSACAPRFAVGQRVIFRDGVHAPWKEATVTGVSHSQPGWPEGFHVPYLLRQADGSSRWVPIDTEQVVRLALPSGGVTLMNEANSTTSVQAHRPSPRAPKESPRERVVPKDSPRVKDARAAKVAKCNAPQKE